MIRKAIVMTVGGLLFIASPVQAGDAAAGQAKAEDCAICHGDDGKGDGKDNPPIAGMAEADFVKAMKEYQSGVRTKNKKMIKTATSLSDEDIANLAAYFATLK